MAAELKRVRSPNYPQVGLPSAILHVKKIWEKNHRHPASRDNVLNAMGYKSYNGASAGVLSALVKFGLLGRDGEDYKVTNLGRDIVTLHGGDERIKAIHEAANRPTLFNQLITHFDGEVPANDDLIRTYLIRKDFAPSTIPQVIQAFRETFDLVEREAQAYSPTDPDNGEEENGMGLELVSQADAGARPAPVARTPASAAAAPVSYEHEQELARGRLPRGVTYRLVVSADVGARELEKISKALVAQLAVQRELLTDNEEETDTES